VRVTRLSLRDFRNYDRAEIEPGAGVTVITGANGAGKTNLLEAMYFGCTAGSPRTSNERELVRRGAGGVARVVVGTEDADGAHTIEVGFTPGEPKHIRVDGSSVTTLAGVAARPLVSVFLPDRLELVKGAPGRRRSHLDQVVAALWPASAATRSAYSRALAQRNALLVRVRAGGNPDALDAWDAELARHGAELMADRRRAIGLLATPFAERAAELGLPEQAALSYRPRADAQDPAGLAAELAQRRGADVDRGFTAHGPHRDDLHLAHGDSALRSYGSQGQQRVALLALLFAERDVLARERGTPPVMLLDDVMSELDGTRRERLAELIGAEGQTVLTATDAERLPPSLAVATSVEVSAGTASTRPAEAVS
jgi:DNA replication and repair protein RecF